MDIKESYQYLFDNRWTGSNLGLTRIRELLSKLGNPHTNIKAIHVAGTNGKGSTCSMLSIALTECGYKTGLYISPAIIKHNERIQINNCQISDLDFCKLTEKVKKAADEMSEHPTVFELITAMAFLYFKENDCDIVILEVGLGGELDATNVISSSVISIITALGLDHTAILGPTIQDVAKAKSGIIKNNGIVINYGNDSDANKVIEQKCIEMNANLVYPDFSKLKLISASLDGIVVDYKKWSHIKIPMPGIYQQYNVAVVLECLDILRGMGWKISPNTARKGIERTFHPARFQVLGKNPVFIVDGGHNPHGIKGTVDSLSQLFPNIKISFIMGVMADKDVKQILELLLPIAKKVYTVVPNNKRAMNSIELSDMIKDRGIETKPFDSIETAVKTMLSENDSNVICAVGSLYMGGDVIDCYNRLSHCKE